VRTKHGRHSEDRCRLGRTGGGAPCGRCRVRKRVALRESSRPAELLSGCVSQGRSESDVARLLDDPKLVETAAEPIHALAGAGRLRIRARLHAGSAAVKEITKSVGMEHSLVAYHLRVLRDFGLVARHREGHHLIYELHDERVAELVEELVSHAQRISVRLANSKPRNRPWPDRP
jgi:ArsR family transcriptional regulator, nickel/cobalt-responsive transcriptional repressor